MGIPRLVGLGATTVYGWWLITFFRTSDVGNSKFLMCLLIALLYVLPIAFVPLIGLRVRTVLKYSLLVVALSLVAAFGWANIEEITAARSIVDAEQQTEVQRWFPFHQRTMIYSLNEGWRVQR